MFKVNNRNTRTRCEIFSKLTIPERRYWRRPGVSIINFENISHLFLSVSIVNLKQVNAGRVETNMKMLITQLSLKHVTFEKL